MHNHLVNASVQLLPVAQDRPAYDWVDEAVAVIQQSGIKHKVGPFATVMEGTYEEVLKVINDVNDHLYKQGCAEWITSVQIQIRSGGPITGEEKTAKFQ